MSRQTLTLILHALQMLYVTAHAMDVNDTIKGHGLIGFGVIMYQPACAQACNDAAPMNLTCSPAKATSGMVMSMDMDMNPSPECRASNIPLLQTIAFCISQRCSDTISGQKREFWWENLLVGHKKHQPRPLLSYQEALSSLTNVPLESTNSKDMLMTPIQIDHKAYTAALHTNTNFEEAEKRHSLCGIILFVLCAGGPVAARILMAPSLLVHANLRRIKTYLQVVTLGQIAYAPQVLPQEATLGEYLMLGFLWLVNVILCAVGYKSVTPNTWFTTTGEEIKTYIANRTGVLSFVNIGILILFAGRNILLPRFSCLSRSSALLFHKHVGIIATLQACLHSAIYLQDYLSQHELAKEVKLPYWIWGSVATLAMSALLPLSLKVLRRKVYEIFLVVHILFSILAVIGSWYHIKYRFAQQWGYEVWLYIAIAIWSFEHLARLFRLGRRGIMCATISRIDEDYIRITIPTAEVHDGHSYLCFPTINPFERHPLSVAACGTKSRHTEQGALPSTCLADAKQVSAEKSGEEATSGVERSSLLSRGDEPQAIFFVRIRHGITRRIKAKLPNFTGDKAEHRGLEYSLPVLLEGPYDCGHFNHQILHSSRFKKILYIAGGVGITALLPSLRTLRHTLDNKDERSGIAMYWTVRSQALVDAVEDALSMSEVESGHSPWRGVTANILLQDRLDIDRILQNETAKIDSLLVLSCAPSSLTLDLKKSIVRHLRQGLDIEFVEERFDW